MKKLWAVLLGLFVTYICFSASIHLEWCPNPEASVGGYKIYYVATNKMLNWKGDVYQNTTSCPPVLVSAGSNWVRNYTTSQVVTGKLTTTGWVSNLVAGKTYYFAVTAWDTNFLESDFSSEIEFTVTNLPPSKPQNFQILDVRP